MPLQGGKKVSLQNKFKVGYLDSYNNFRTIKTTDSEVAAIRLVNYLNGGTGDMTMFMSDILENCLI